VRVVIVGAGQVGSTIAESLADTHEVIVIDVDSERVDALTYSLDVLPVEGDGTAIETLTEAGVAEADMVIACTDDDETNIVCCGTVQTLSDAFTIARVRSTNFLATWERSEGALGVDLMVGTNYLTAESIVRVIGMPGARDVDTFADGLVQMAEFDVTEDSPIAGKTVAEADTFDSLTFAAIIREHEVIIPRGDTRLRDGDEAVVIGSTDSVGKFARAVDPSVQDVDDVLVVGGSDIGRQTAELLCERGLKPRIIEPDPEHARALAEELPDTMVLNNDPTDREFLEREHIADVDVVITTLGNDDRNLLASLLAKRLGAEKAVAIVEDREYAALFEAVGVDIAVNPREAIAEEITRFTREQYAENVAMLEDDRAEVLEVEVEAGSVLADRPIRESIHDLPDGVVIGAISRGGALVIPRGDTVVEVGDHIVVFVETEIAEETMNCL
jgi:trk system potassium uptake protein TrkA